jgi:hypothetical protein
MKYEDAEAAVQQTWPQETPTSMCQRTADAHKLLTELARRSGVVEAIGLRAAAGAITHLRRKLGCIQ